MTDIRVSDSKLTDAERALVEAVRHLPHHVYQIDVLCLYNECTPCAAVRTFLAERATPRYEVYVDKATGADRTVAPFGIGAPAEPGVAGQDDIPNEHVLTCNASRRKPIGCDMCSCPSGREIKRLRARVEKLEGALCAILAQHKLCRDAGHVLCITSGLAAGAALLEGRDG